MIVDFSNGIKRSPITDTAQDEGSAEQNVITTSSTQAQWTLVVTFDRQGKKIYMGTNRGHISVVDSELRSVSIGTDPIMTGERTEQRGRSEAES